MEIEGGTPVKYKTRTYHGRFGARRRTAERLGQGEKGQNETSTGQYAQEATDSLTPQSIENNCPECLFGSTNNRNSMLTDGETRVSTESPST